MLHVPSRRLDVLTREAKPGQPNNLSADSCAGQDVPLLNLLLGKPLNRPQVTPGAPYVAPCMHTAQGGDIHFLGLTCFSYWIQKILNYFSTTSTAHH